MYHKTNKPKDIISKAKTYVAGLKNCEYLREIIKMTLLANIPQEMIALDEIVDLLKLANFKKFE